MATRTAVLRKCRIAESRRVDRCHTHAGSKDPAVHAAGHRPSQTVWPGGRFRQKGLRGAWAKSHGLHGRVQSYSYSTGSACDRRSISFFPSRPDLEWALSHALQREEIYVCSCVLARYGPAVRRRGVEPGRWLATLKVPFPTDRACHVMHLNTESST